MSRGRSKYDCLATLTAITAWSIADACRQHLPRSAEYANAVTMDDLYLSGGGSKNSTLVSYISDLLPHTKIRPLSELGIPAEAIGSDRIRLARL